MTSERRIAVLGAVLLTVVFAGCAAQPFVLDSRQSGAADLVPADDPDTLVGLAVSGGGSRAASFTASVLQELARQVKVDRGGRPGSLIEYVNYISSVSGGSLATAYYGINKPDRSVPVVQGGGLSQQYEDFFRRFRSDMERNYELSFIGSLLLSDATRRAQALSDTWDSSLFHHATFLDLYERERRGNSPKLILNGTSWADGRRFVLTTLPASEFSFEFAAEVLKDLQARPRAADDARELSRRVQDEFFRFRPITFEEIRADPRTLKVSLAVAASSSVPLVIGPVMFQVKGSDRRYHIGDGGLFDNQGIESLGQIFFKKLKEPASGARSKRRGLILVIDASYPFGASDEELNRATSAAELLKLDPSRVSDIMEQRARSYQLLLWGVLRGAGVVVPNEQSLRIVYLRHTDVDEAIVRSFPEGCRGSIEGEPTLEKIKVLLSRIPTRFEIDKGCHAALLAAAAKDVVAAQRASIGDFFRNVQ